MNKKSIWSDDLQQDLYAWLDDIEARSYYHQIDIINGLIEIVELLPPFVQNWTVGELVSALQDR